MKLNLGNWNSVFAVPSTVVDRYLKLAGGQSVKLLLYMLRKNGEPFSLKDAAEAVGLSLEDAADAITFWCEAGILRQEGEELSPINAIQETAASAPAFLQAVTEETQKKKLPSARLVSGKPTSSEVVQRAKESKEFHGLLCATEAVFSKTLNSSEQGTLLWMNDYLGLPPDVIIMLMEYCLSLGKSNMGYIEKVAKDWAEREIDSHEKADDYLKQLSEKNHRESLIRSAFRLPAGKLSANESKFIKTWFDEFGFDIGMIKLAYDKARDATGKVSFAYINSILTAWNKDGVDTSQKAQKQKEKKAFSGKEKDKPSFDIEELERQNMLHTPEF